MDAPKEKVVTIQKKEVSMTAGQFMENYLLRVITPQGNSILTVRRQSKMDKDAIALAEAFGVPAFTIPSDKK